MPTSPAAGEGPKSDNGSDGRAAVGRCFNKAASLWAAVALLAQGLSEVATSMWADCLRGPDPNWRPIGGNRHGWGLLPD